MTIYQPVPNNQQIELESVASGNKPPSQRDLENEDVVIAEGQSNIPMAFMNMANSILGAGVIGQPFAIKNCGLIGGVFVLPLLTILVDWTIRLIVVNLKLTGKSSYQDTVEAVMGKKGKILIISVNGLFAFGGCAAFCVIIGDTLPHVLRTVLPSVHRNIVIFFTTLCISYPLSLNRDISKLSKTSALALVSMITIVVVVIARGVALEPQDIVRAPLFNSHIFQGISVISFALVCHHNTSFIFASLHKPTLNRFDKLTHISCVSSFVVCAVMGYSGVAVFGSSTKGNILNNFSSDDPWINLARFCFGFNMLTTFPLEIFVLRDVFKSLLYINAEREEELTTRQHFVITTFFVFSTMAISLFTCNLGALFELIGATTASIMAYILPPWCNLMLTEKTFKQKIPHYLCILFGFMVMFISSSQTIISARNGEEKSCEI